jgi:zinc D-Ala-D-Ala dipeptidase
VRQDNVRRQRRVSFVGRTVAWLCTTVLAFAGAPVTAQQAPPAPFVYLRDVDPTVIQDIRYATENNFTGRIVPGYEAPECILTRPAAIALSKAQSAARQQGASIKVYDCYRPKQAVEAFVRWARSNTGKSSRNRFHPGVPRHQLLAQGYIAAHSQHSRGLAIDAGLVRLPPTQPEPFDASRAYGDCTEAKEKRAPDDSIDFGTDFDCFDERSHTSSKLLSAQQISARKTLVKIMADHGFTNYRREWWHFTFGGEGAGASHDFPIRQRPGQTGR